MNPTRQKNRCCTAQKTAVAFAISVVALFSACRRNKNQIELDHRFSINIAQAPAWFPREEQPLTPAEREVIRRRGKPDFFRFWWTPDGSFITSSDLAGRQDKTAELASSGKKTWLYVRDKIEVEFLLEGGYAEHPFTDKLSLLCRYGDPDIKSPAKPDAAGKMRERWTWIGHGLEVEFLDGREINRKNFTGTGSGTYLVK